MASEEVALDDDLEVEVEVEDEVEVEEEEDPAEQTGADEVDTAAAASPPEPEVDDPAGEPLAGVRHEVSLSDWDCTPNVFSSVGGVLSGLSQGPFLHLLSAARADTGAKAGRYLFELEVLEKAPIAQPELRVGFSVAGSSLFVGETSDSVGFAKDGTYFMAEPGQLADLDRQAACTPLLEQPTAVIGLLLNLDPSSKAANTVSLFLNGCRAGPPQPVPSHLKGKTLFPTVNFRGLTLAVNFGCDGIAKCPLPFSCRTFSQIAAAHHEMTSRCAGESSGELRVIMPIGLPDAGIADFTRRLKDQHPDLLELGDRAFASWCRISGKPKLVGQAQLARDGLAILAHAKRRSVLLAGTCQNLQEAERRRLLSHFSPAYKKVALVAVGSPSEAHKQWVHKTSGAEYDSQKAIFDKRRLLAEATGEYWDEENERPPERATLDPVLPQLSRGQDEPPDVTPEALAKHFAGFTLPSEAEGFGEVNFEWSAGPKAQEILRGWLVRKKSAVLLEGLQPGEWFRSKLAELRKDKMALRGQHVAANKAAAEADGEAESFVDLHSVDNINDVDGFGTPLYRHFRYEDWVLLYMRYELHLLVHGFADDVADPDVQGMSSEHVVQYYLTYFGVKLDPMQKLGVASLVDAVRLLREPVEFKELDDGLLLLRSSLEKEAPLEVFVKGVEAYRRDRQRRIEAGDESAVLRFPRASAAAAVRGVPAKAAPVGKNLAKAVVTKAAPVAARAHQNGAGTGHAVPVKAAPKLAKAGMALPAKAAPRLVGLTGEPPPKRVRVSDGPVTIHKARPAISKMRPTA